MTSRSLACTLSALCCLAGGTWLAAQAQAAPAKAVALKLTAASNGKNYTIKKGDTFSVTLPSNPSTGYAQCMIVAGSEPWSVVGRSFKSDAQKDIVGTGGLETITFKAGKAGTGQVTFVNIQTFNLETLKSAEPWSVGITVK